MVTNKIRLAVTVLIILAVCAGMVICTAEAATGSTSGKSAGTTGKTATTGFNTAATGKVSVSATPAFGSSVFGNALSASNNVFGTTNSLAMGTPQGSFANSFGQSFTPGAFGTGNIMASATPAFGSSIFGNTFSMADNTFAKATDQVVANQQGSFVNTFGQSFTPGVSSTGSLMVSATPAFGSSIFSNTQSVADNAFARANEQVVASNQGSFITADVASAV